MLAKLQLVDLAGSECAGEGPAASSAGTFPWLSWVDRRQAVGPSTGSPLRRLEPITTAVVLIRHDPRFPVRGAPAGGRVGCQDSTVRKASQARALPPGIRVPASWRRRFAFLVHVLLSPEFGPTLTVRPSLTVPGVSGVTGPALRETSFINRSLAALADVLGALAERRGHVPYRNSKLTHLLQDALGN